MIDKFNGKATCKGSYLLGTACGHCPKCIEESCLSNENSPSAIIKKLQHQLEIQTKRVENLKKSNEFYADRDNWINTAQYKPWNNKSTIKCDTDDSTANHILMVVYSGKLARSCQAIDQELEKQLGEVK